MSFAIPATPGAVLLVFAFFGAIRIDAFGNRVAVNAKRGGGVRDALLVSRVGFLNIKLLEFLERFILISPFTFNASGTVQSVAGVGALGSGGRICTPLLSPSVRPPEINAWQKARRTSIIKPRR